MLLEIQISNTERPDLAPINLPLFEDNRFRVTFVDGLNPVKADVATESYALLNRDFIENTRVGSRNIVLTLELVPDYSINQTVQDLRDELYQVMSPMDNLLIRLRTDKGTWFAWGVVESFDAPLFVQDPAVQLSILCEDPYFRGGVRTHSASNPNGMSWVIFYGGKHSSPFTLTATPGAAATGFELRVKSSNRDDIFSASGFYPSGRPVVINTLPGEKSFQINGETSLNRITAASAWPALHAGSNTVIVKFAGQSSTIQNSLQISYQERVPGI